MTSFKKYILPAVVFITGACVLVIEVTATRILSPYFGNTIYTVSSIIGVILAALSLGYYFGGRLSDQRPDARWFYGIILLGGLTVLLLELIALIALPALGSSLSLIYGPLLTACLLFFLPAAFLGMLSPYAIKLELKAFPEIGVGEVSGIIFFWSTLGSIFGSFLTGFVLIPFLGIDKIIINTGVLLFLLGFIPLAAKEFKKKYFFILAAALILIMGDLLFLGLDSWAKSRKVIYSKDGVYEKLLIFEGEYKGRPVRLFQQDRSNSAAMFLDGDDLVFDYTKYYGLYKVFKPEMKRALVIGGGAYSIPKALLDEPTVENVDVAEIEPSLYELGRKYFRVPDDPRLKNHITDGRRFLAKSENKYDLIFSDVYYSLYSVPVHFTTEEFFKLVKSRLNDKGVFMANFIGKLDSEPPSLIFSEMKTLREVFPNSYFFAVNSAASADTQNLIFVGYNSANAADFSGPEIVNSPDPVIRQISAHLVDVDKINFQPYAKLTDNYAPGEYLTAKVLD